MPKLGFERYISRFLIFNWKLVFADNSKLIGPNVFLKNHHTDRFLTKTGKPADELQYQDIGLCWRKTFNKFQIRHKI